MAHLLQTLTRLLRCYLWLSVEVIRASDWLIFSLANTASWSSRTYHLKRRLHHHARSRSGSHRIGTLLCHSLLAHALSCRSSLLCRRSLHRLLRGHVVVLRKWGEVLRVQGLGVNHLRLTYRLRHMEHTMMMIGLLQPLDRMVLLLLVLVHTLHLVMGQMVGVVRGVMLLLLLVLHLRHRLLPWHGLLLMMNWWVLWLLHLRLHVALHLWHWVHLHHRLLLHVDLLGPHTMLIFHLWHSIHSCHILSGHLMLEEHSLLLRADYVSTGQLVRLFFLLPISLVPINIVVHSFYLYNLLLFLILLSFYTPLLIPSKYNLISLMNPSS